MTTTSSQEQRKVPTDITTIKLFMTAVLEESYKHMSTLREREWVSQMIDLLKGSNLSLKGGGGIKPTGIVRHIDELGRAVLPKELRTAYGIGPGDPVEITLDELSRMVVIQPYSQACHFCSGTDDIHPFKGKFMCESCLTEAVNTL